MESEFANAAYLHLTLVVAANDDVWSVAVASHQQIKH